MSAGHTVALTLFDTVLVSHLKMTHHLFLVIGRRRLKKVHLASDQHRIVLFPLRVVVGGDESE